MFRLRMVSFTLILTILFSTAGCSSSNKTKENNEYNLKSTYLKNPDSIIKIADQSAKFWEQAYDPEFGGFYPYINRDGSVDTSKTYKISINQFRNAYAFAKAYQLTGKKEYLDYAQKGLDFVYKHAWDKVNGGWYQEMNRDGSIAAQPFEGMNYNDIKWYMNEFNALQGITAVVGATRSKLNEEWLEKSVTSLNKEMWDSRPGYEGYYDMAGKDWSNPSNKSQYTTLEAITSHAKEMYLLDLNSDYKKRLISVADSFSLHIAKTMNNRQFGIVDAFDNDWNPLRPQPVTSSGNFLKSAWCLDMAYLVEPKEEYKTEAEKLIKQILDGSAYDNTNGGSYASLDPETGMPTDKKKCWWILEDGVTSGLIEYYITKKPEYLKMADESMDFFMKYMYDSKYGDTYGEADADGSNPDMQKGRYWKEAFHMLELCYYTYMYGNLMLQDKPVTLYYNIESGSAERDMLLNPIALGQNKLIITGITLNGNTYKQFDGSKCLVRLPANTGGELKVTFKRVNVN